MKLDNRADNFSPSIQPGGPPSTPPPELPVAATGARAVGTVLAPPSTRPAQRCEQRWTCNAPLTMKTVHELRGAGPEQVFAVLPRGATERVERPRASDAGRRGRYLPGTPNRFIGRAGDMAALADALRTGRLTTLVGPGGVGKTRLAIEVARQVGHAFNDGVWFVALDELREPDALGHALLAELEVRPIPGQAPVDALAAGLRASHRLVVLDNCEHLLANVALMLSVQVNRCPALGVLATSRAARRHRRTRLAG